MKTVAIVPVYNEAKTVVDVLDRLEGFVDDILIINDGSRDESESVIMAWLSRGHKGEFVTFAKNQGYATVIMTSYELMEDRLRDNELDEDDIIVTIDADGQHRPDDIPRLISYMTEKDLDGVRARRRLDEYPKLKQVGNKVISLLLSPLAGQQLYDALSGYWLLRARTLPPLLDYVTGYRYSTAPEISIILPRLGFKMSDSFYVDSPFPRSNTLWRDVAIDLALGVTALAKVEFNRKSPRIRIPAISKSVKGA